MLIEDTVHTTIDAAPLINAALGITIRGAGLTRATGGMRGFWNDFTSHYRAMGGDLYVGCRVSSIRGCEGEYSIATRRGCFSARQVVCALPIELTARIGPPRVAQALATYLERDYDARGGAVIVFLGVAEEEVSDHSFTHHQLLYDYRAPLGNGNNMFISVSAPGDTQSAPAGYRAVMISTHCDLQSWQSLTDEEYSHYKVEYGKRLVDLARRIYPQLATNPIVWEVGTPRTYERFTCRPRGAVGGTKQSLKNSNQWSVPHDIGVPGFWLAGDTTWPGLGTVACVLGSRIVAEGVQQRAKHLKRGRTESKQSSHSSGSIRSTKTRTTEASRA
jgi:phytoene dehydrogenase-like protein